MFSLRLLSHAAILSSLLLGAPLYSVIIVIHGTFAANEKWHSSDGDLVRALRASYSSLPDSCPQKNSAIISFRWSGHNNAQARISAAKELGNLILSYPDTESISLIGHSHAGNVIALLSRFLRNPLNNQSVAEPQSIGEFGITSQQIDDVFINLEPVRSLHLGAGDDWDSIIGFPCAEGDLVALHAAKKHFEDFYCQKAASTIVRSHSLEGFSHKPPHFQKKIELAILLGTPVDVSLYSCDMTVVERCYALHSSADLIQTVGGFYERVFPPTKNLLNLKTVVITTKNNKVLGLGHSSMHSPLVGSYLLLIPHLIEKELDISASKFDEYPMLILVLFEDESTPVVVDAIRTKDGTFHPLIQKKLNEAKKSPASQKEAGLDFTKYYYDYSM
jgi:hypothetical protein